MKKKKFSIIDRLKSFQYAWSGLKTLWEEEHNSRVHFLAAFLVLLLGWYVGLSDTEWYVILILIGFVFSMELLNSAIENISDLVSPEKNELIKKAKDQSAAAVLVSAGIAFVIGIFIFVPKIIMLLKDI